MKLKRQLESELSEALLKLQEIDKLLTIAHARQRHLEIELAQSRVSADSFKSKYNQVVKWIKNNTVLAKRYKERSIT